MHVEFGDFTLHLSKTPDDYAPDTLQPRGLTHIPNPPSTLDGAVLAAAERALEEDSVPADWIAIRAPHLGTFYRAPKPGADPYVEIGQTVTAETEVWLLEVMKLFTSIRAGYSGVVRRLCARDAELVESSDLLFLLRADPLSADGAFESSSHCESNSRRAGSTGRS